MGRVKNRASPPRLTQSTLARFRPCSCAVAHDNLATLHFRSYYRVNLAGSFCICSHCFPTQPRVPPSVLWSPSFGLTAHYSGLELAELERHGVVHAKEDFVAAGEAAARTVHLVINRPSAEILHTRLKEEIIQQAVAHGSVAGIVRLGGVNGP